MKFLTKYLKYIFIMFVSVLILTGCGTSTNKNEKIMKLSVKSTTLTYAESYRIDYELNGIDKKDIAWESSNPDLVSVDKNGKLFVKQNTTAEVVIIAKDVEGNILSKFVVNVYVNNNVVPVTGVSLNQESIDLQFGDEFQAIATVAPANVSNNNVIWTSSDPTLVKVDSKGLIKVVGNRDGMATVSATTSENGYTAVINVNVRSIKVSGVKLNKKEFDLKYGTGVVMEAEIVPSNAANKNVEWFSSDPSLVMVDNGYVYATDNRLGTAVITVKSIDGGYIATAKVNVIKVNNVVEASGIKLDYKELKLNFGDTKKVVATITPSNATNKNIIWSSSDPSLVLVDSLGNISANANRDGTAVVTAKTADGKHSASVNVTTSAICVKGIAFSEESVELQYQQSTVLTAMVTPNNAANKAIIWSSSDPSLITVDSNGKVTVVANRKGEVTITAKTVDGGYTATKRVISLGTKVNGVSISPSSVLLEYGSSQQLTAVISPNYAINKTVKWVSSNENLVSVDSTGKITAVGNKNGSATITVQTVDGGYKASVVVKTVGVKVSGVSLNQTNITLAYDKTAQLVATVTPSNAINKNVTWSSSDLSLVTVDSTGKIKAVANKDAQATITVTTNDGNYKANALVTIVGVRATGITLNKTSLTLAYGKSETLLATISPSNAINKGVTWSSSDTSLVSVDNTGKITVVGNKAGSATISAKTSDGKYSATCKVTTQKVTVAATGITLNATSGTIYLNNSTKTVTLKPTVLPVDATNKSVTWSSSDTAVATVSNGVVTAKNLGKAVITAKTSDGKYSAKYTLSVRKRVVIVIGASQVTRMQMHVKNSYVANNSNMTYNLTDYISCGTDPVCGYSNPSSKATLNFIYKSGSGMDYQTGDGLKYLNMYFSAYTAVEKTYVDFHVYFPLVGNTIASYTCNNKGTAEWEISQHNAKMISFATNYNNVIQTKKNEGYSVQGYVVSMHPVRVSQASEKLKETTVVNSDENSCSSKYRSNWKYYKFNTAMKWIITNNNLTTNLKYEPLFTQIMDVNNEGNNFGYKWSTYNTSDGVHWLDDTTVPYVQLMLDYSGDLSKS